MRCYWQCRDRRVNICPSPGRWHEIHKALLAACNERRIPTKPPVPLILNGWVFSNDIEKAERWNATEQWAQENGLAELVAVPPEDWYRRG